MSKIYIGVDEANFVKNTSPVFKDGEVHNPKSQRILKFKINGNAYELMVTGKVEILGEKEVIDKLSAIDGFKPGQGEYELYTLKQKDKEKQEKRDPSWHNKYFGWDLSFLDKIGDS